MPKVLKDSFDELYELADGQAGYFTAKQALAAGYSDRMQTYHVQAGDWIREWRGIYRLRYYPNPRPDDLMLWYLWSCDREGKPQGVYSHDTALELHELSSWTGTQIHMTVPRHFRRSIVPPKLKLHHVDTVPCEIAWIRQVPATSAARTLLDLLAAGTVEHHHLVEAMSEARRRGLIVPTDFKSNELSMDERESLLALDAVAKTYVPEA